MTETLAGSLEPGFIVLQGDRLEWLRDAVLEWLRNHPLQPLEEEIFLVQSNGIAEWLQWTLAEHEGICAAVKVMLPGRFLWDSYVRVLGREQVASRSPLDKQALTWRLIRLLPQLLSTHDFAPLQHYHNGNGSTAMERRWQMAAQIADLFDQYQVYRSDWLQDWAEGRDTLRNAQGQTASIPADQRWQSRLWQAVQQDLLLQNQSAIMGRAEVHQAFIKAMTNGVTPRPALPRRVILFGAATLPEQSLSALAALGQSMQIILAVPNPCRFYWGDIISGRELLRRERRRQPLRQDRDLSQIAPENLHSECNVLLAQWGRQGRDFLNMLEQWDDTRARQSALAIPRIDLFSEDRGETLLRQLQVLIREQEVITPEHCQPVCETDHSIVFHVAHSALRELQVLHDQLLDHLATGSMQPRDIIVMVPEISRFAPLIRATFDQYDREDARYIPYHIVDLQAREESPLLQALDWLLQLPEQRCQQSEIRDLLHCPAFRRRFGLETGDLLLLESWLEESGWRWGLSAEHRHALGMSYCGAQNTGAFALQRLNLGYANGHDSHFAHIEAYGEVGGLDAALLGPLNQMLERLENWQHALSTARSPQAWAEAARLLLADFFSAEDADDAEIMQQLDAALQQWLEDCALADFAEELPLAVFRANWLDMLNLPELHRHFLGGGVTFCTLLPMRAVPYAMICLLGMNEEDYPRRNPRPDYDLMALADMSRPGDRSRRDDDHYLMLEALLAARQILYISWTGRDPRNNQPRQPALMISQLRDAIARGWPDKYPADDPAPEKNRLLRRITLEHPLQAFSRKYLEHPQKYRTWAREWFPDPEEEARSDLAQPVPALAVPETATRTLRDFIEFFRCPARAFYRQRLDTFFGDAPADSEDNETFVLNGLDQYSLLNDVLEAATTVESTENLLPIVTQKIAAQLRSGQYAFGILGQRQAETLRSSAVPILSVWQTLMQSWQPDHQRHALYHEAGHVLLDDWLPPLYLDADQHRAFLQCRASRLLHDKNQIQADKMADIWIQQLLAADLGIASRAIVLGKDAVIHSTQPIANASDILKELLDFWGESLLQPLPVTLKTAVAAFHNANPAAIYEGNQHSDGEVQRYPGLARDYPDFARLSSQRCGPRQWGFQEYAEALYRPFADWLEKLEVEPHA
ncbi:exodeoxyribonuclease V subunit gamma [Acidithiobacillus albertensis]|uniref:exodeoxyribonuclease V subunit gamma n=1 Tax=Acidithiobacillus albertensis TaxID=119978 RepID=UPI00094B702E|nr:exodeoxyribonuclease V subunit gamma [Acidithiobacillus albertensis]